LTAVAPGELPGITTPEGAASIMIAWRAVAAVRTEVSRAIAVDDVAFETGPARETGAAPESEAPPVSGRVAMAFAVTARTAAVPVTAAPVVKRAANSGLAPATVEARFTFLDDAPCKRILP